MTHFALFAALFAAVPLAAADDPNFDPATVRETDAIECRLDAPSYNGFAFAISGEEALAKKRHWRKIDNGNPFLTEYELPAPIQVAGSYSTRRIAFSSNAILAILDLADPGVIAGKQGITNAADAEPLIDELVQSGKASRAEIEKAMPFRKFLGEKVLVDSTELPANGESFGTHMVIARTVSNATSHPGKTLYGCSYQIEPIGKDGKPL